jgi:hypothetical protein
MLRVLVGRLLGRRHLVRSGLGCPWQANSGGERQTARPTFAPAASLRKFRALRRKGGAITPPFLRNAVLARYLRPYPLGRKHQGGRHRGDALAASGQAKTVGRGGGQGYRGTG